MKDQDEMFEAATETPAFLGCPSLGPKTLPGGSDGVEPVKHKVKPEAKAKLETSYLSMRGRLEKITDLALAADAKCGTCDKIGQNWTTCSKAIAEIRRICKESMVEEVVPDYEWLAKIMTDVKETHRRCISRKRKAAAGEVK